MGTLALLGFAVFAVADWIAVAESNTRLQYIAKPAALGALLIWAASAPHPPAWLIAALALSLLGDVYLMLPDDRFIAGLLAFLLAHFAYIGTFDATFGARLPWFAVVLLASAPITRRILGAVRDPSMRVPVAVYTVVVAFMLASALASGLWLAVIGGFLFVVSDGMIAWSRFVEDFASARVAIIVTYHVGQWFLVAALR